MPDISHSFGRALQLLRRRLRHVLPPTLPRSRCASLEHPQLASRSSQYSTIYLRRLSQMKSEFSGTKARSKVSPSSSSLLVIPPSERGGIVACSVCNRGFSSQIALDNHSRRAHDVYKGAYMKVRMLVSRNLPSLLPEVTSYTTHTHTLQTSPCCDLPGLGVEGCKATFDNLEAYVSHFSGHPHNEPRFVLETIVCSDGQERRHPVARHGASHQGDGDRTLARRCATRLHSRREFIS